MGMEKYESYVRKAKSVLAYDPGWSLDNKTGSWRTVKPVKDVELCNECGYCWLYCPEGCIEHGSFDADLGYCKGCGICQVACKAGAIRMEREGE